MEGYRVELRVDQHGAGAKIKAEIYHSGSMALRYLLVPDEFKAQDSPSF
jgi:hypothetical protein